MLIMLVASATVLAKQLKTLFLCFVLKDSMVAARIQNLKRAYMQEVCSQKSIRNEDIHLRVVLDLS